METEKETWPNLKLWKRALLFHVRHRRDLFPLIPILIIPLWTDCYHSVLVKQEIENDGKIMPFSGIWDTLELMPSFVVTKFKFFFVAFLWSFLPVIGWYKDFSYRIKWAMVSNVIVFEKLKDVKAEKRCENLSNIVVYHKRTNSLLAIPTILFFCILIFYTLTASTYMSSILFWISILAVCWILLPVSAVANTFVYLSITDKLPNVLGSHNDYK
jgi:hypothetical protein